MEAFTGADGELRIVDDAAEDLTYSVNDLSHEDDDGQSEAFQVHAAGNQTAFTGFVFQEPGQAN